MIVMVPMMVPAVSASDGSFGIPYLIALYVWLGVLFIGVPAISTHRARFATVAALLVVLIFMVTNIPAGMWIGWLTWLLANWWALVVAAVLLLMPAFKR